MLSSISTILQRVPVSRVGIRRLVSGSAVAERSDSAPEIAERNDAPAQSADTEAEVDKLYRRLTLEARGHDPAVLRSYRFFVLETAKLLDIPLKKAWEPPQVHQRRTVLRANFAKAKYLETYEARTYFQIMEFMRLTGSTADTFLEYIERNVPEGVAMKVTKEEIQALPHFLRQRPQE